MGGLPASELAILSTEELLLDRAWRAGRLLVNSSIYVRNKKERRRRGCIVTNIGDDSFEIYSFALIQVIHYLVMFSKRLAITVRISL